MKVAVNSRMITTSPSAFSLVIGFDNRSRLRFDDVGLLMGPVFLVDVSKDVCQDSDLCNDDDRAADEFYNLRIMCCV